MQVADIVVPPLGDVEEVKVVRWLHDVGDEVQAGEAVAEVEAEKATFVIEAPVHGRLFAILVPEGRTAAPGDVIGKIEEEGG
ncbi:MAG TPA: biotin attachment protein [Candidatus Acetothermia bacterium]|nr:biotin attachment protein [Candidatus Bipolaricaulota bacterium]HDI10971.1 biotin attachment protein [Candidatus Acetothermia bacterium]